MLLGMFIIGVIMFFGGLTTMILGMIYDEFGFADFIGMIIFPCGIVMAMFCGIGLLIGQ